MKWATLGRHRASMRLPKALQFDLHGKVPKPIWVGPGDHAGAKALIRQLEESKWLAVDTEYEPASEMLIMWSVSNGKVRAAVHADCLPLFSDLLLNNGPKLVMHNAMADLPVFARRGLDLKLSADTMLMDFYVDENRLHGLKACAYDWLGLQMVDFTAIYGKRPKDEPFAELPALMMDRLDESVEYASLDAYATYHLFKLHKKILKGQKTSHGKSLWKLFREVEVPFLQSLYTMARAGIAVNPDVLSEIGAELEKTVVRSRWVMQYLLPETICVQRVKDKKPYLETIKRDEIKTTSHPQLASVFYDVLGRKSTIEDEPRTTREECLRSWADDGCVLSEVILSLRRAQKMRHDFVGYRRNDLRGLKDGKKTERHKGILYYLKRELDVEVVHTHINPIGTVTGRISASEPNLQQVPARVEKDPYRIRRAFTARPGCILVVADYDQAELRVLAHLSQDAVMLRAFRQGIDLHAQTAIAAFGLKCEWQEVKALHPDKRAASKAINFGIVYGRGSRTLARQIGVSDREAGRLISAFFHLYRGVHEWIERTKKEVAQTGYVETILGRRRRLPNIFSAKDQLRGQAERQAVNSPIQGSVGDIMRRAMVAIGTDEDLAGHEARTLLQVHDELVIECPRIDAVAVRNRVRALMEGAVTLSVPLKADAHLGPNWELAKGGDWEQQNGYAQ